MNFTGRLWALYTTSPPPASRVAMIRFARQSIYPGWSGQDSTVVSSMSGARSAMAARRSTSDEPVVAME